LRWYRTRPRSVCGEVRLFSAPEICHLRAGGITARSCISYLLDKGIVEVFTFFHHQVIRHIDILLLDTLEGMLERNGYKEE
jgi:hypothetical protein